MAISVDSSRLHSAIGGDDGLISEAEWKNYLQNTLKLNPESAEFKRLMLAFERMDGSDNMVSKDEWNQRAHKYVTSGNSDFGGEVKGQPTFDPDVIDTNKDGYISDGEFREYLSHHKIKGDQADQAWNLFREHDINNRGMNTTTFSTLQNALKSIVTKKPDNPTPTTVPPGVTAALNSLEGTSKTRLEQLINLHLAANKQYPSEEELDAMKNLATELSKSGITDLSSLEALIDQLPDSLKKTLTPALTILAGADQKLSLKDIELAIKLAEKLADGTLSKQDIEDIVEELPNHSTNGISKDAFRTACNLLATNPSGGVTLANLKPEVFLKVSQLLNTNNIGEADIKALISLLPENLQKNASHIFKMMGGTDNVMNKDEFKAASEMVLKASDGKLTVADVQSIKWPTDAEIPQDSLLAVLGALNFDERDFSKVGPKFMEAVAQAAIKHNEFKQDTVHGETKQAHFLSMLKAAIVANKGSLDADTINKIANFSHTLVDSTKDDQTLSDDERRAVVGTLPDNLKDAFDIALRSVDSDGFLSPEEVEMVVLITQLIADGSLSLEDKQLITTQFNKSEIKVNLYSNVEQLLTQIGILMGEK